MENVLYREAPLYLSQEVNAECAQDFGLAHAIFTTETHYRTALPMGPFFFEKFSAKEHKRRDIRIVFEIESQMHLAFEAVLEGRGFVFSPYVPTIDRSKQSIRPPRPT